MKLVDEGWWFEWNISDLNDGERRKRFVGNIYALEE